MECTSAAQWTAGPMIAQHVVFHRSCYTDLMVPQLHCTLFANKGIFRYLAGLTQLLRLSVQCRPDRTVLYTAAVHYNGSALIAGWQAVLRHQLSAIILPALNSHNPVRVNPRRAENYISPLLFHNLQQHCSLPADPPSSRRALKFVIK